MEKLIARFGFLKARWPERLICFVLLLLFVALLVPMVGIGMYAFPRSDDLTYGAAARQAWLEAGSLSAVLSAAVGEASRTYMEWQGTFPAVVLMALQPGVFGDAWYAVGPVVLLSALTLSTLFFCRAFFHRFLGASRTRARIVALTWLLADTQLLPAAWEGFYWYNGAIYYTFFFALSLCLFALALLAILEDRAGRRRVYAALACLMGALVGGGNYPTALLSALVLVLMAVLLAIGKNRRWRALLPALVSLFAVFALSVAAPGNATRAASYEGAGALASVVKALYFAAGSFGEWLTFPVLALLVFLCPLLWSMAKQARFSFRYPLLVAVISFGFFAAQACPTYYAMNSYGPTRFHDIVYYSYIFLLILNLYYGMGWAMRKYALRLPEGKKPGYPWALAAFVFVAIVVVGSYRPAGIEFTSVSAARSLLSGEAAQLGRETQARLALLNDASQMEVELEAYTVCPEVLLGEHDEGADAGMFPEYLEAYYGKDSVVIR